MDQDYFLPPEDQRVFGAGISRKRVQFVRSSDHELNTTTTTNRSSSVPVTPGPSIADRYLSIVLSKETNPPNQSQTNPNFNPEVHSAPTSPAPSHCDICNLPLTDDSSLASIEDRPHEASLAHQVCLSHSHPPSHLDRTRHGLRYLSAFGWDPDSRLGLGAPGREGIREPLKGKLKVDTVGLGAGKEDTDENGGRKTKVIPAPVKVQKLNAKQVRKGHSDARKRGVKLREMFYQSDDVLKYLGGA
ncbi:hypothetical protein FE257_006620 [Aspergillus nanangensis]|uniref:G-patch domain-containing protein n=1 Tax=Aspergillus nanangensis TaxID=2582783 RepID=A0AAD4GZG4_ASPNN|nr:hypothetical protein FE257_006620 [Aspergillus nanangensis]